MYRNLYYMKGRIKRKKKSHTSSKIDFLLSKKENESTCDDMTLTFLGYVDENLSDGVVEVETHLKEISQQVSFSSNFI